MPAGKESTDPARSQIPVRPRVLYVMGAGRSGSTILGVALGNCPNVFFAGELDKWLPRSGIPRRSDPELTDFWAGVRRDMAGAESLFGARTGRLERSSALLDPRNWPDRRRLRRGYRRVSEELYVAVAHAAHASNLVDSSHYPLRARELQALDGIDLYLLYLVRDPRGVVASLGRRDVPERRFNMLTSNAYLWLTHLLAVRVFFRHPRDRRMLVRHEDFVEDPRGVLRQILEMTGSFEAIPELESLRTGVPFHGNRLVGSDVVTLNPRPATPVHRSRVTSLLQLPWRIILSRLRPATASSAYERHVRSAA